MRGLPIAILMMGTTGCVSQIFLDGPVDPAAPAPEVRIVHVTPVPTPCPQGGTWTCYLVTDGPNGERLLAAPPGRLHYVAGSDYVVEVTEQRAEGSDPMVRWVVNRVVDYHPRAR